MPIQQGAQKTSDSGIGTSSRETTAISLCWDLLGGAEVEEAAGNGHEKLFENLKLIAKRKGIILPPLLDSRAYHSS